MLVRDIPADDLQRRLRGGGLQLVTGAFTTRLRIRLPHLVREFVEMYAEYPIEYPAAIDDADLRIEAASALRRYVNRQAAVWISGERLFDPVPIDRAYMALESAMNWAVASSDVAPLILHSAVVEREGSAVLLPAPTGSGKSTLCAALAWRGWRLMSDEMAAFSLEDGTLYSNPRPVSLKNRAVQTIAAFEPRARFSRTYRSTPKGDIAYMHAPPEALARAQEGAAARFVIAPSYREGAATQLKALSKADGFRWLVDNAVNYSSKLQAGFDIVAGAVDRCGLFALTYSDLDEAVTVIDRLYSERSDD